ncbi:MAG: PadR family transcriptional regulator [Phycisphaerales bacterium JB043]
MPRLNRTRFAILGMLTSGPKSGYDLKREFEERISHFWNESLGQIYPALHKLHKDGLVAVRVKRDQGRPERKEYRITKSGSEALRTWLEHPADQPSVRNEMLLKVFFGPAQTPQQVLRHVDRLETHEQETRVLFKFLEGEIDRQAHSPEERVYWKLALSSGRYMNRARLAWCREARTAIESLCGEMPCK